MNELTIDTLRSAYVKLKEQEENDYSKYYSLILDDIAARKWKRMIKKWDKQDMSNRARRLLRNRRKMK